MNSLTDLFQINGRPLLAPDADMALSFEDLEADDSGRDESGVTHRVVLRHKVKSWSFAYSRLTGEEWEYMCSLLPREGDFLFTYPLPGGGTAACTAYCDGYGVVWRSARTGDYRNLKFTITEC